MTNPEKEGEPFSSRMTTADNNKPTTQPLTDKDELESEKQHVDKGWSWMILIACFLSSMITIGYYKSFGILFIEFQNKLNTSASMTSLIIGMYSAVYSLGSLFVLNGIYDKISVRKIALFGAMISTLGVILSAFASNIEFLIMAQSVVLPLGHSAIDGPGMVLLGKYFEKRRALATAIATSGVSVGSIVLPILLRFLFDTYGMSGALLIMGGITFHTVVSACLYRPFPKGKPECYDGVTKTPKVEISLETDSMYYMDSQKSSKESYVPLRIEELIPPNWSMTLFESNMRCTTIPEVLLHLDQNTGILMEVFNDFSGKDTFDESPENNNKRLMGQNGLNWSDVPTERDIDKRLLSVEEVPKARSKVATTDNLQPNTPSVDSFVKTLSVVYASNPDLLIAQIPGFPRSEQTNYEICYEGTSAQYSDHASSPKSCLKKITSIVDLKLFRNPMFILIWGLTMLGIVVSVLPVVFVPSLAKEKGLTDVDAALLLSLSAGLDLVSRILAGLMAELGLMKRHHIIAAAFGILGVIFQFTAFYSSFGLMVFFVVAYGIFGGVYFSLIPSVVIDFVGIENFPKAFGFVQVFHGGMGAVTYPILGALCDATGTYTSTFHYIGVCALVAVAIILMEPLARRLQERNNEHKKKHLYRACVISVTK